MTTMRAPDVYTVLTELPDDPETLRHGLFLYVPLKWPMYLSPMDFVFDASVASPLPPSLVPCLHELTLDKLDVLFNLRINTIARMPAAWLITHDLIRGTTLFTNSVRAVVAFVDAYKDALRTMPDEGGLVPFVLSRNRAYHVVRELNAIREKLRGSRLVVDVQFQIVPMADKEHSDWHVIVYLFPRRVVDPVRFVLLANGTVADDYEGAELRKVAGWLYTDSPI